MGADGVDGVDGTAGADGADGVDGPDGEAGDTGDASNGSKGFKGTAGALGSPGPAGPAGGGGSAGANGVLSAYSSTAAWQAWDAKYNAAVADYDNFDGSCDSTMDRFVQIEDEIQQIEDVEFGAISSTLNDASLGAKSEVNQYIAEKQSEVAANLQNAYQHSQEMINYLQNILKHEMATRAGGGAGASSSNGP